MPADFSWWDLFRAYWFLLDATRWCWLCFALLLFAVQFYALVPPLIVGKIVDFFTGYRVGDVISRFYLYIGILGGSFVIVSFVRLSIKRVIGNLQSEVIYRMKVKGFERLLDFSLSWHLTENAGAKAQRVKNGVESYKALSYNLNNEVMRSAVATFGTIGVFAFLRPQYIVFFCIYFIGFWTILTVFYRRIYRENETYFSSIEKASGSYVEGLSNILTIKTLGAGGGFKGHVAEREGQTKTHEYIIRTLSTNMWKSFHVLNGTCFGIFLFMVGRDVITQQISPGAFVVFWGYMQSLVTTSGDMMDVYEKLISSKAGIGRMMGIFWTETAAIAGKEKLPDDWKRIDIGNANFTWRFPTFNATGYTGSSVTIYPYVEGIYPPVRCRTRGNQYQA